MVGSNAIPLSKAASFKISSGKWLIMLAKKIRGSMYLAYLLCMYRRLASGCLLLAACALQAADGGGYGMWTVDCRLWTVDVGCIA